MTVAAVVALAEEHRAARNAWIAHHAFYERRDPSRAATYVAAFESSKSAYLAALARLTPSERETVPSVEARHIRAAAGEGQHHG